MARIAALLALLAARCAADHDSFCSRNGLGGVHVKTTSVLQLQKTPAVVWDSKPLPTCHMTSDVSCPISTEAFKGNSFVSVYPGGKTRCLDGSDYFFQVRLGSPKKLYIRLQGGGICLTQADFNSPSACRQRASTVEGLAGITDLSNIQCPLQDFSVISIPYCSGDVHSGNTDQLWGSNFSMVPMRGFINAKAAIDYALSQFPDLSNLVLSGDSAGSQGLQFWSNHLLKLFATRSAHIVVILDSQPALVYRPNPSEVTKTATDLAETWNLCNHDLLNLGQMSRCFKGRLWFHHVLEHAMKAFPSVRFASINSKADSEAIYYTKSTARTVGNIPGTFMTNGQWYRTLSLTLQRWIELYPNFHSYLVDGDAHIYLNKDRIYNTTPQGLGVHSGSLTLLEWFRKLIQPTSKIPKSVCEGPTKEIHADSNVGPEETTYCTPMLLSK
jgi:hypothetical protein